MRKLFLILLTTPLVACGRYPIGMDHSENAPYQPLPTVALSTFSEDGRVVSVYVRHSQGSVLLDVAPHREDFGVPESELKLVMSMCSAPAVEFAPSRYENFARSIDVFQDGRIILVPLPDDGREALGVFVNLLSGKRYFFAPTLKSAESAAMIRSLANRWPDITVIIPEDRRAPQRIARFPEFEQ